MSIIRLLFSLLVLVTGSEDPLARMREAMQKHESMCMQKGINALKD